MSLILKCSICDAPLPNQYAPAGGRCGGYVCKVEEAAKLEAIKAKHPRWEYIRFEYGRWTSTHENYDCSWEGEEDGWVSNNLMAEGRTLEELEEDMAAIEEDHPEFADAERIVAERKQRRAA